MGQLKIENKADAKGTNNVAKVIKDPEWEPQDWKNPDFDTSPKN